MFLVHLDNMVELTYMADTGGETLKLLTPVFS